jgi:membrane protein involved in colicin uptake
VSSYALWVHQWL